MSMTNIDSFIRKECDKIDANKVNAYVDFHLDEENPTGICLESSWGGECLDLKDAIKAGETCTKLSLSPEEDPSCLVYEGECENNCIPGDELSRIISMSKLKDVDQSSAPRNGDIYMYEDGVFKPFNLKEYMDNMNIVLGNVNATMEQFRNQIKPMLDRWKLPNDIPDDAKIVLGNINLYSDENASINSDGTVNRLDKYNGLYGHDLTYDKNKDEIFG